eukprot:CAMPEP_0206139796 /NCGR_PEP_ID=MMETSP1473-20131121/7313_1 /ASSEMBLY_ACC=CAM_ASM_001109 /TAXON_ID=1461547 /ORGANISM="Stichococcus sp, Strain RCC1054" /LENGTH=393 /DNA_ID=CAMNT_0053533703 /DNA_START=327 /DNA_END=1508 /DNA_ORIENTATION=-
MDAWNPDQLLKMQAGGNNRCNDFLRQYGIPKTTDIKEKYNSQAAEFLREKIKAEVEKRPYTPPPPSSVKALAKPAARPARGGSAGASSRGGDDWGEWGGETSKAQTSRNSSPGPRSSSPGARAAGQYSKSELESSAANKDSFFARQMEANASRPEGLPPNQGGKYVGFGSGGSAPPRPASGAGLDQVTGALASGWTQLSSVAGSTVAQVRSNEQLQQSAAVALEKSKEYGTKSWGFLRGVYANVATQVESVASEHGYKVDLGARGMQGAEGGGMQGGRTQSQPQLHNSMDGLSLGDEPQRSHSGNSEGHYGNQYGSQPSPQEARPGSSRLGQTTSGNGGSSSQTFAGFEDATDAGWDDHWDNTPAKPAASKLSKPAPKPAATNATDSDDWGKW